MSDWGPAASLEALRARARILAAIRAFFAERDVLEVETPALSAAANLDPHIDSLVTSYQGPGAPEGRTLHLHTSPEFPMKRLLVAGSGPIYQLCRVFRQGESGRLHNPEFTMLEWYRPGWDHHALMDEVEALAAAVLGFGEPAERLSYADAFQRHLDLNPHGAAAEELIQAALAHGISPPPGLARDDRDGWLDLLLSQRIEPLLGRGRPTFLYDYPASQAALARVGGGWPPVARRFELYIEGVELANGFHELADAAEQRRRFESERARREAETGQPAPPLDERLLAALEAGLPDCAGVALGVDRLVMQAVGGESLEEVLAFPLDRA